MFMVREGRDIPIRRIVPSANEFSAFILPVVTVLLYPAVNDDFLHMKTTAVFKIHNHLESEGLAALLKGEYPALFDNFVMPLQLFKIHGSALPL